MAPLEADPPWLRDALRGTGREITAFLSTTWAMTRSPRRFAAEWSDGRRHALNPLACELNSLAILGPWRLLLGRLLDVSSSGASMWLDLGRPLLRAINPLVWACAFHFISRLFGSQRPLRSSLGVTLFVVSGPVTILSLVSNPVSLYQLTHVDDFAGNLAAAIINIGVMVVIVIYLGLAMAGVHRRRGWQTAVAVLVPTLATFVGWGWLGHRHLDFIRQMLSG